MLLKKWDNLPDFMRNEAVRPYYHRLRGKPISLICKRLFDTFVSAILLLILWPVMLVIAVMIRCESKGSAIFKQERVTQYGRTFKIWKFRTMVKDAEKIGTQVTVRNDSRITKFGKVLRNSRLDELPQLINIFVGDMSFVGTRPDVLKYVERYTDEMMATLLLPAGVTSEASIQYKDEYRLLNTAENVDEAYVTQVLPGKMAYNLDALMDFGIIRDVKTMVKTVLAVCGLLQENTEVKNVFPCIDEMKTIKKTRTKTN